MEDVSVMFETRDSSLKLERHCPKMRMQQYKPFAAHKSSFLGQVLHWSIFTH